MDKTRMITPEEALPGRPGPIPTATHHFVSGRPLKGPWPEDAERIFFGMGCFWGAEKRFWSLPGVWVTAVGYMGGHTPNPLYEEVCSGQTGHAEVVMVVYRPQEIGLARLLQVFWEGHDPTQGMRQGNDVGTQYRSGIWCTTARQLSLARRSRDLYAGALAAAGHGRITTTIAAAPSFYYAEAWHQQYLARNPGGYCGLGGTGVPFPLSRLRE
jgi:peptide-methionine (S)-S-oxide reductase